MRPQVTDGQFAPEDFVVTIQRPSVEGPQPGIAERLAHHIPWHHRTAQGAHRQHDDDRQAIQLPAGATERRQQQAERGRRAGGHGGDDQEAVEMSEQVDAEDQLPPDEHQGRLQDAQDRQVAPFAEQQLVHRKAGGQQPIERLVFAFLQQCAATAGRAKQQEHHRNPGGIHRHHRIALVIAQQVNDLDSLAHRQRAKGLR